MTQVKSEDKNQHTIPFDIFEGSGMTPEQVNNQLNLLITKWAKNPWIIPDFDAIAKLNVKIKQQKEQITKLEEDIKLKNKKIVELTPKDKTLLEKEIEKNLHEALYPSPYRIVYLIKVFQGMVIMGAQPKNKEIITKYLPHIERAIKSLKERNQKYQYSDTN